MKSLIIALATLASASSFAQIPTVATLTSYLPLGTHFGTNDRGDCKVVVTSVNSGRAVNVTVTEDTVEVSKLVVDGTEFGGKQNLKQFIQTDTVFTSSDRTSYKEKIIRTTLAGDNQLYVVTADTTVENTDRSENSAECVIDL